MPTIKDIAKAADVSIATVSIVLNGKGKERKISGETQKRILEIAHKMINRPKSCGSPAVIHTQSPFIGLRTSVSIIWPVLHSACNEKS